MDIITVEARYNKEVSLPKTFIDKLSKEVILFTTVQYMNSLETIKKQLEDAHITVQIIQPRHTCYKGQLLGCSTQQIDQQGDVVYIGDGLFHPKAILMRNKKKVCTYNPKTGDEAILDSSAVEPILKRLKGLYAKFISAKKVGVLLTLKPGQYKPLLAKGLEERYPDKTFYYFVDNTYNFSSLVDFSFVDMFLNTMCERIGLDDMNEHSISLLNIEDLNDLESGIFD